MVSSKNANLTSSCDNYITFNIFNTRWRRKFLFPSLAAHNVFGKGDKQVTPARDLAILLGKFKLNEYEAGSKEMNATDIILHPGWDPETKTWNDDIAIILFEFVVELTTGIQPVVLPDLQEDDDDISENGFVVKYFTF